MSDLENLRAAFEDKTAGAVTPERLERVRTRDYRPRQKRRASRRAGLLLVTATVTAALAAVLVAVGSGGSGTPTLTGAEAAFVSQFPVLAQPQTNDERSAGAALNKQLAEYPVLAQPQTPGERSATGAAQRLNQTPFTVGGSTGKLHYKVQYLFDQQYRNLSQLTRAVTVNGVQVWFFVVNLHQSRHLPRTVVSGNDPKGASVQTSRTARTRILRFFNMNAGYQLWVRVGAHGQLWELRQPPTTQHTRTPPTSKHVVVAGHVPTAAEVRADLAVQNASLPGPHGTIVAIAPRNVAHLTWQWPREFDSSELQYRPATSVSAPVRNDVAVATAPKRFTTGLKILPYTVRYTSSAGRLIDRNVNESNNATTYGASTQTLAKPAPETARSRAAERDPSTPNRVVMVPDTGVFTTGALGADGRVSNPRDHALTPMFFFRVLLNHVGYWAQVTGGPHPGCIRQNGWAPTSRSAIEDRQFIGPTVRGDTYADGLPLQGIYCRGTYRLSVSVITPRGHVYKSFGSATFSVR